MDRDRDDSGQFVEEITLEDVVRVLRESDGPIVTAKEIGGTLGCSGEAARQKLIELRDRRIIDRRQVGAGAVVWWLAVDDPTLEESTDIDPDDPLLSGDPLVVPDDPVDESEIDDVLYGGS